MQADKRNLCFLCLLVLGGLLIFFGHFLGPHRRVGLLIVFAGWLWLLFEERPWLRLRRRRTQTTDGKVGQAVLSRVHTLREDRFLSIHPPPSTVRARLIAEARKRLKKMSFFVRPDQNTSGTIDENHNHKA